MTRKFNDLSRRLRHCAEISDKLNAGGTASVSTGDLREAADEIERLRTALATVRIFIEGETVAHAVVVPEGANVRDTNNPSLLQMIDAALGHHEQNGDGK